MTTDDCFISVIVPVRNDPNRVRELLACLAAQTLPRDRFEVVVGDDGSAAGALEGIATADGWVRVVSGPPRTSYAARNRAVRGAHGAVLAFCDSDCQPRPNWLESGLAALEQADVVAGEVTFIAPARPTAWSLLTMDIYLDQSRNVLFARGVTANLFVRRPVYEAIAGFDESLLSGGDYDFVTRAVAHGARLIYSPGAVVLHPTLDTAQAYLRKVWTTNRWAAARRSREGRPLNLGIILTFFPFIGMARARQRTFRPLLQLTRPRLAISGVQANWLDDIVTMSLLYTCISYVAGASRIRGWVDGRRMRRERLKASARSEAARA